MVRIERFNRVVNDSKWPCHAKITDMYGEVVFDGIVPSDSKFEILKGWIPYVVEQDESTRPKRFMTCAQKQKAARRK